MARPLEGIRVVDLTRVLAGPFCTMVLSDLGADVIKVEIPGRGDDSRAFGPFKNGTSLYFFAINRGKRSVTLNLKTERGRGILLDLVMQSDVLVENYSPGVMERLGLGYEMLREHNSRLIYAAISGFGHTGPDSKRPAYDILVQAMGGIMSITGWPDMPPTRVGMSTGDITASLFTAVGIMGALYEREKTGRGQKVDVAMLDCQLAILENAVARFQVDGVPPGPLGNRHPTITPFQAFKALDGYFVVGAGNDGIWVRLCQAIGRPDWAAETRFATNASRTDALEDLIALLEPVFAVKTVAEWLVILEAAGVPCGPVNTIDRVVENRQLKARNMLVDVEDPVAGTVLVPGNPIKLSSVPIEPPLTRAPDVGEHTDSVLSSLLGMPHARIDDLRAQGVV
ncbi:CoA transferase [Candidatus Fermentibacteria bacterium]|nr:CoA transferase [Candidatus Fermentibacteria bacterium]